MSYLGNNCSDYTDYCCSVLTLGNCTELPIVVTVMSYLGNNCSDYTDYCCSDSPLGNCTDFPGW